MPAESLPGRDVAPVMARVGEIARAQLGAGQHVVTVERVTRTVVRTWAAQELRPRILAEVAVGNFTGKGRTPISPVIARSELVRCPSWCELSRPVFRCEEADAIIAIAEVHIAAKWLVRGSLDSCRCVGDIAVNELIRTVIQCCLRERSSLQQDQGDPEAMDLHNSSPWGRFGYQRYLHGSVGSKIIRDSRMSALLPSFCLPPLQLFLYPIHTLFTYLLKLLPGDPHGHTTSLTF